MVSKEPSVAALKGKILGVTDPGGTNYQVTKMILSHYGLVPLKDVQLLTIGEEKLILDAMLAGRIAGAAISPPWPFEAEKHGFKILVKASDVAQFPFAGICTNLDKIKSQREQVKKVIRAELDALRFIRERRQERIDLKDCGLDSPSSYFIALTRQIFPAASSATSNEPSVQAVTPTGRP